MPLAIGDGLVFVVEGHDHDHGPEELLLHRGVVGLAAGDERGRHVEAGGQVRALAPGDQLTALLDPGLDQGLHPAALHRRR